MPLADKDQPSFRSSPQPGTIWVTAAARFGYRELRALCPDRIGGIASCCDSAGSAQPDVNFVPLVPV